jgi:hypothetical protein
LSKVEVDIIAMVIRLHGVSAPAGLQVEDAVDGDPERENARSGKTAWIADGRAALDDDGHGWLA